MNKVWTFGDSFTQGNGCNPYDDYYEFTKKDRFSSKKPMKIFPDLLGMSLGLEVNNFARGGASNSFILRSVVRNIDKIKKGDFVVIGYTDEFRFEIPHPGNRMHKVLIDHFDVSSDISKSPKTFHEGEYVGKEQNKRMNYAMYQYVKEIHMMKLYRDPENPNMKETYGHEVLDREVKIQFRSLINYFKQNNIAVYEFDWTKDDFIPRYEQISYATKGKIQNYHLSWKGHEDLSNNILEHWERLNKKVPFHPNSKGLI